MDQNKEKIRYILQYHFDKGDDASQACEKICGVYDEGSVSKSAARKWFARCRSRNFDVKDEPRPGRAITENSDEILDNIEQDQHISSYNIAYELNIHHQTVLNHLQKAGFKKKLDVWMPHELSVKNQMNQLNICNTLLKRNEIEPLLKPIITGDEKWIKYENIVRKRSWKKRGERSQTTS